MKVLNLLVSVLLLTSTAFAEVERTTITCTFTNPYLTTIYKTVDLSFTVYDPFSEGSTPPKTLLNVHIRPAGDKRIHLVTQQGEVLQKLHLTGKGSDGVSEVQYPYSVEWMTDRVESGKHIGGCTQESED